MGILSTIFSKAAATVVDSVGTAFDKNFTSKEEKDAAKLEITKEINRTFEVAENNAKEIYEAELKDIQSSRDANVKIQESDKASWLAKNVGYCIDVFLILVFSAMLWLIVYHTIPAENKELFYTSFGMLGMYVGQCISFHRGTSAGSHAKQQQLNKLSNKE